MPHIPIAAMSVDRVISLSADGMIAAASATLPGSPAGERGGCCPGALLVVGGAHSGRDLVRCRLRLVLKRPEQAAVMFAGRAGWLVLAGRLVRLAGLAGGVPRWRGWWAGGS
jgi:hypothetical protein